MKRILNFLIFFNKEIWSTRFPHLEDSIFEQYEIQNIFCYSIQFNLPSFYIYPVNSLENNNIEWNDSINQKFLWTKIDVSIVPGLGKNKGFGRCFTLLPTTEITKYGIKNISLRLKKNANVYFHTPGAFQSSKVNVGPFQVELGNIVEMDVRHELFNR